MSPPDATTSMEGFSLKPPTITHEDLLILGADAFMDDAVAIVTGAGSGIGQATCLALSANGVTVVGFDIDPEGLAETTALIESFDLEGDHHEVTADLTDDTAIDAAIETASEVGPLGYLLNIAGMQHIASIAEFPMDRYELLMNLMVRAPWYLTKRMMPHFEEGSGGVIANMSSIHGHVATQDKGAYITAKHALNGLTKAIAAEGDGAIRSFTVSVGYVLTPLMVDQIESTARSRGISERAVVEDVMLGPAQTKRMMTPAEVANLFVFGLSDHGEHLNGGDLLWDGGFTTTYD